MPDSAVTARGQLAFGAALELLHAPVVVHAASPDAEGREIRVLDSAFDVSYFFSLGVIKNLETSLLASMRAHQSGAGAEGVTSQSGSALSRNAVRDPRLGVAYSFDDALALRGFGLRLALDATLPLGDREPFANERSFVVMPNATLGYRAGAVQLGAEFGVRLRRAIDFAGAKLGNQGFFALGVAASVVPRWLTVSAEVFALPALSDSVGSAASPRVTSARLIPAEWLLGLHSSFGHDGPWTLSVAGGSGIPLSSETRDGSNGPETSYFMGLTTPDFRSLVLLRFAGAD